MNVIKRIELTRGAASALNAVSLADAKAHCRVTHSDDDTYIDMLIGAASHTACVKTKRSLINATHAVYLDDWPDDDLLLPAPPYSSMTHVKYYDTSAVQQTLSNTVYRVDGTDPAIFRLAYDQSWPSVQDREEPITITYTAGYGATPTSVPHALRAAILLHIAHLYERREPVDISRSFVSKIPYNYDTLIAAFKNPVLR